MWCNAEVFLKLLTTSVKSLHFYRGKHTQHKFTTLTIFRSQSHFHAPITTTLPRTSSTSQTETPARETITPHPSSCRPHCFTTTIRFSVSGFDPSMYFKNGTTQFSHLVSDFFTFMVLPCCYITGFLSFSKLKVCQCTYVSQCLSVYPLADILTTVNDAAMDMCANTCQVSASRPPGDAPRSGMAGSYGNSRSQFLRSLCAVPHSSYIIFHSHQ